MGCWKRNRVAGDAAMERRSGTLPERGLPKSRAPSTLGTTSFEFGPSPGAYEADWSDAMDTKESRAFFPLKISWFSFSSSRWFVGREKRARERPCPTTTIFFQKLINYSCSFQSIQNKLNFIQFIFSRWLRWVAETSGLECDDNKEEARSGPLFAPLSGTREEWGGVFLFWLLAIWHCYGLKRKKQEK